MACGLGIGRFIYTPILPHMVEDLHLTKGGAGLIASANFVGYLAGALLAAAPSARAGSRVGLLAALAVSALTTAAMSWSQAMDAFLMWRFLGGVASAYVLVLSSALVLERLAAAGHQSFSAIHFAGVGAGIALSSIVTWLLDVVDAGWRAMWLSGGLLSLAGLAAVAVWVPKATATGDAPVPVGGPAVIDDRLKKLALAYGLFGFGYVITATFIVVIVRGSASASQIEPVFWLVLGLSAIPSVALWMRVAQQIGITRAFTVACAAEAIGVFASVAWPGAVGLLIASILLGGTFMGLTALGLVAARNLAPADPKRWLAILTAAFGVGQIIGPIVAGYGFDLTGSFALPSMLAVIALGVAGWLAFTIERTSVA
jgi:predicted MFS family arabinose efflux permease